MSVVSFASSCIHWQILCDSNKKVFSKKYSNVKPQQQKGRALCVNFLRTTVTSQDRSPQSVIRNDNIPANSTKCKTEFFKNDKPTLLFKFSKKSTSSALHIFKDVLNKIERRGLV